MEARKAADGRQYTLIEFIEHYGTVRGQTEWCDAAQRHTLSELKQWASDRSLSKTGNKNDLLEWLGRFDCFVFCNRLQERSTHELQDMFQPQDVRHISDKGILVAILAQMEVNVPLNQAAYQACRSVFIDDDISEFSDDEEILETDSESDDELGVSASPGFGL